ncbi:MAG: hypothetical protein H7A39_05710 [Chlamydiales bacterium]|nr:hypothetical protein [Chlamydiales bacterium]
MPLYKSVEFIDELVKKFRGGIPSVGAARKIEEATEGKVRKEELLFPNDVQNEENNE